MDMKRKRQRELAKMNLEYWSLIFAYEESIFILGSPDPFIVDYQINMNIFEKYNDIWISFCQRWESKNHITKPDPSSFYRYVFHDDPGKINIDG